MDQQMNRDDKSKITMIKKIVKYISTNESFNTNPHTRHPPILWETFQDAQISELRDLLDQSVCDGNKTIATHILNNKEKFIEILSLREDIEKIYE